MILRYAIFIIFTFLSCSSNMIKKEINQISNPFITSYTVDEGGYLYISITNPTKDEFSISSLEYLCNVNIKSKKNDKYLNAIKVRLNCDDSITKLATLKPNETKTYYLQIFTSITTLIVNLSIHDTINYYEEELKHQNILMIFFSSMIILALYNIFVYFFTRVRS